MSPLSFSSDAFLQPTHTHKVLPFSRCITFMRSSPRNDRAPSPPISHAPKTENSHSVKEIRNTQLGFKRRPIRSSVVLVRSRIEFPPRPTRYHHRTPVPTRLGMRPPQTPSSLLHYWSNCRKIVPKPSPKPTIPTGFKRLPASLYIIKGYDARFCPVAVVVCRQNRYITGLLRMP